MAAPPPASSTIQPGISFQSPLPLAWLSFSGSSQETAADFIQSIQRIAFQYNRIRDERWITEYVSTCFKGEALYWFVELDEETQGSWKLLRLALTRRFPAVSKPEEGDIVLKDSPSHFLESNSHVLRPQKTGRIEVVGSYATTLGYLAFDPSSGVFVTPSEANAIVIAFPDPVQRGPCHIQMLGLPAPASEFPFLGLILCNSNTTAIPKRIEVAVERSYSGQYAKVPQLSQPCKLASHIAITSRGESLATWTFSNCGRSRPSQILLRRAESPQAGCRAMGAVWTSSSTSEDLKLSWLMDDQAEECSLGVYIQKGSLDRLHVHRESDFSLVGPCLDERRVYLVFKPSDPSKIL